MMTGGVTKVALHNIDTFHQEDMRKDFEFDDFSIEYYVDYQVRIAKERIREDKVTCKEDYNFDTECVYNKFDEISESTTTHCTLPVQNVVITDTNPPPIPTASNLCTRPR